MDTIKCPHCGSDNDPGSAVCGECGVNLRTDAPVAYPPPSYPPPVQEKKGISGLSTGMKIGLSLAVLVAVAIVGFVAYKVIKTVTYPDLKLDTPPAGYEQLVGEQFEEAKKDFAGEEEGGSLDALYFADNGSEQIFIAHITDDEITIVSFGGRDDPPETDNLNEMEEFIRQNRSMMEEELEAVYREISLEAETLLIEAVQLESDGICGILISANIPLGEGTLLQDRILFFKDGVTYIASAQNYNGESNAEDVQYLLENLYFE